MKKLKYKKAKFESFDLKKDGLYAYEGDVTTLEEFIDGGFGSTYVCPECIRKYDMYEETETTEESLKDTHEKYVCCVVGCANTGAYEAYLDINNCKII